jgi:hypothetical protein
VSGTPPSSRWPRWLTLYKPQWSTLKQLLEEFWLPILLAVVVALGKRYYYGGEFIPLFGGSFAFFYFVSAAYVRLTRQQNQDAAIKTLGDQLQKIGAGVILISDKLPDQQAVRPLLINLAQSTLSANNVLREISATLPSEGVPIPVHTEYYRYVAPLTPEQEEKLRSLTKKSE